MKTKTLLFSAWVVFLISSAFTSHKPTSQNLTLRVKIIAGNNPVNYAGTYQSFTGRQFNITDLSFYISNIVLIKNDGSQLPLTGKVLLVDPSATDYNLGGVPAGNYKGYKFNIGLDATTNQTNPASYPAGNPLAVQNPSMYWNATYGYIFFKFEGKIDVTENATGSPTSNFYFQIGTNKTMRTIDMSNAPFSVVNGSDKTLKIDFDLSKAMNTVFMETANQAQMLNGATAKEIADNFTKAFVAEQN